MTASGKYGKGMRDCCDSLALAGELHIAGCANARPMTDTALTAAIQKAVNCDTWPKDISDIVDIVVANDGEMSTEQAVALGIILARSSTSSGDVGAAVAAFEAEMNKVPSGNPYEDCRRLRIAGTKLTCTLTTPALAPQPSSASIQDGGDAVPECPPAYNGCTCACHRRPGMIHFVACCSPALSSPPPKAATTAKVGEITDAMAEAAARNVATAHYAKRFDRDPRHLQVTTNVNANWHIFEEDARIALTAAQLSPVSAPTHRHVKRGTEYVLIGIGKMQTQDWRELDWATGSGDGEYMPVDMREVAIYRSATDPTEMWVRPLEEFNDGRFASLHIVSEG